MPKTDKPVTETILKQVVGEAVSQIAQLVKIRVDRIVSRG